MTSRTATGPDPEVLRKFEEGCRKGNHILKRIIEVDYDGGFAVVRCCKICGTTIVERNNFGAIRLHRRRTHRPAILERR